MSGNRRKMVSAVGALCVVVVVVVVVVDIACDWTEEISLSYSYREFYCVFPFSWKRGGGKAGRIVELLQFQYR